MKKRVGLYQLVVKVSDSESEKTVCRTISVPEQAYLENDIGDYIDDLNSIKEKSIKQLDRRILWGNITKLFHTVTRDTLMLYKNKFVKQMLKENNLETDFTAGELLKVWCKSGSKFC